MAVRVFLDDPDKLINGIRKAIADGTITTWSVDRVGDLTLTSPRWHETAWMRPKKYDGKVVFNILGNRTKKMSKGTYAAYHSGIVNIVLQKFDDIVDSVAVTPHFTSADRAGGSEVQE
jgi:hypothetical protein